MSYESIIFQREEILCTGIYFKNTFKVVTHNPDTQIQINETVLKHSKIISILCQLISIDFTPFAFLSFLNASSWLLYVGLDQLLLY